MLNSQVLANKMYRLESGFVLSMKLMQMGKISDRLILEGLMC